jgi:hypothetical protein
MGWAGLVARMGEMRNLYKILVDEHQGEVHLEYLGINGIILEWILEKWSGKVWTGLIWFMIGCRGGLL